jgi:hypothetical protein
VIARRAARALPALLFAGWTAVALHAADDLQVTARLQPDLIGVDELAYLNIEVQGSGFGGRSFEPDFELDNLEIVNGPSTSQSFRFVNGSASRSLTLSWVLRPLATGPARARSIEVQVEDQVFRLPDAAIEVQKDPVGRAQPGGRRPLDPLEDFFPSFETRRRPAPGPRQVFLRAEIEPANPFVGQQALYTLYLFTQVDVTSISPESLPDFAGFWVRELPQPADTELEMVDIDGRQFGRLPVLRRAVFALRPGEIELESARVQLTVRVPDSTFGSMFSQTEQLRRDSNAVKLAVRPLPAPAPPDFQGAVGSLEVATRLEPAALELGDAATYSVTLSGVGHLQGLAAPTLPEIAGLRIFPPQQESDESVLGRQIHGRRRWSFVLVPEAAGSYELPPIELAYFDPGSGAFAVASAEASHLEVSAAPAALAEPAPPTADAGSAPLPTEPGPGGVDWMRVLPWTLIALLLGALALLMRRRGAGDDPAHALEAALRLAAAKDKPREAAALIEDGWRAFLEARWQIPPGLPSTQWGRRLGEGGAPAASAESLVALADDLHYLRYAPKLSDTEALKRELIVRSTKLSRTLK